MTQIKNIYEKFIPEMGLLSITSLNLEKDIDTIYDWVNRSYAKYWQMSNTSIEEVRIAYEKTLNGGVNVYMGHLNGIRKFLIEDYKPIESILKGYYEAKKSDRGFHILLGPVDGKPIPNFSWNVFKLIMDFLFKDKSVNRIVVEPDVQNSKIHRLNKRIGFEYQKKIFLLKKIAYLAFCTRKQYSEALKKHNYSLK